MAPRAGILLLCSIVVLLVTPPLADGRSTPLPSATQEAAFKKPMQTQRPFNVAHRGANGEYPEETFAAYQRAIEVGADFIETDILATKDGKLICFHDVTLDATTDVANFSQFAGRNTTYVVQDVNVTGFFIVDFTWEEIQTLRVNQRFPDREPSYNGKFGILSFDEYIQIALTADRIVGIYPEIKNPVFINEHVKWAGGKTIENVFVETLLQHGYYGKYMSEQWMKQPVLIQSFAPTALVKASNLTDSPLIFLIDDVTIPTQDTNQGILPQKCTPLVQNYHTNIQGVSPEKHSTVTCMLAAARHTNFMLQSFAEITSDSYFEYLTSFGVVGLGPWKDTIAVPNAQNYIQTPSDLVARAHAHGLQVHPYTYRNENSYLKFNYHLDPYEEYAYWSDVIGVDGFFTDFARTLRMYQDWASPLNVTKAQSAAELISQIADLVDSFSK